jgi:hypothetical protein
MTRRGGAGKGSGSKGCRGAEHGQACTKERTGAVALRAALESAVQLGQGDEVNRQAEMAQVVLHAAGEGSIWDGEGSGHRNRPRKWMPSGWRSCVALPATRGQKPQLRKTGPGGTGRRLPLHGASTLIVPRGAHRG